MASLKKIIYIIGEVTLGDDTKYMSIRDICTYFDDETNCYSRISSQLYGHPNLFTSKKLGGRIFWKLNANGRNYLSKFKDSYDPITDKLLFQPDKIEVF